jgi:hypothetical protein
MSAWDLTCRVDGRYLQKRVARTRPNLSDWRNQRAYISHAASSGQDSQ